MPEIVYIYDAPRRGVWGWQTGAYGAEFFCLGWWGIRL